MHNNGKYLERNRQISGCPICGYREFKAFDEKGLTTYDICPCCGNQSGHSYGEAVSEDRILALRRAWVSDKQGEWYSKSDRQPIGWSYKKQLEEANMSI